MMAERLNSSHRIVHRYFKGSRQGFEAREMDVPKIVDSKRAAEGKYML